MKGKTCCVTGHRDLPQNEINKIKTALAHEIDAAVTDGFTCFMSGFADGVDQYFAELVLERKQTTPALELIAVIRLALGGGFLLLWFLICLAGLWSVWMSL